MILTGDDSRWKAIVLLGKAAMWPFKMRPRVSLFGLLLLVTAAACCAAYVGSEMRRERRLREWSAGLERRGASVMEFSHDVVFIHFSRVTLTDDDFARLRELHADRCALHFHHGDLNDELLLSLASVNGLENLVFYAEDVSLAAVQEFERRAPHCNAHAIGSALR